MRAVNGTIHRKRRRKVMKAAAGFRGGRRRLFKTARQAVMKAGMHAFAARRQRKRHMRALWIARINAAARMNGVSYSVLMNNLKKSNVHMDRKALADLANSEPQAFQKLVESTRG